MPCSFKLFISFLKKASVPLGLFCVFGFSTWATPNDDSYNFPYAQNSHVSDEVLSILTDPSCNSIGGNSRAMSKGQIKLAKKLARQNDGGLSFFVADVNRKDGKHKIDNLLAYRPHLNSCGASSLKILGPLTIYYAFMACENKDELRAQFDNELLRKNIEKSLVVSSNSATRFVFKTIGEIQKTCSISKPKDRLESEWGMANYVAYKLGLFNPFNGEGGLFACDTIYGGACKGRSLYQFGEGSPRGYNIPASNRSNAWARSQFITADKLAKFYLALSNSELFPADIGTKAEREGFSQRMSEHMSIPLNEDDYEDFRKLTGETKRAPSYGIPSAFLGESKKVERLSRKTGSLSMVYTDKTGKIRPFGYCANDFGHIKFEDGSEMLLGINSSLANNRGPLPATRADYKAGLKKGLYRENYKLNSAMFKDLRLIFNEIKMGRGNICGRSISVPAKSGASGATN